MAGESSRPSARQRAGVCFAAAAVAVTAGCAANGPGSGSRPSPPVTSPATTSPARSSPAAAHLSAAQRRAVRTWLAGPAGRRARGLLAAERAVLADLSKHRSGASAAFVRCQPEQVEVERAEEARSVPWRRLDPAYADALARLASATTHCLNAAGLHATRRDMVLARRQGRAALRRLAAVLAAARGVATAGR